MQSYSKDKVVLFFVEAQVLIDAVVLCNENKYSDLRLKKLAYIALDIFHPPCRLT